MDFHRLWLAWLSFSGAALLISLVWFCVQEALALRDGTPGNTLSEVVWALNLPPVVWIVGGGSLVSVIAVVGWWVIAHFVSGGRWGI